MNRPLETLPPRGFRFFPFPRSRPVPSTGFSNGKKNPASRRPDANRNGPPAASPPPNKGCDSEFGFIRVKDAQTQVRRPRTFAAGLRPRRGPTYQPRMRRRKFATHAPLRPAFGPEGAQHTSPGQAKRRPGYTETSMERPERARQVVTPLQGFSLTKSVPRAALGGRGRRACPGLVCYAPSGLATGLMP
jgi:hypothetical protein